MKEFQKSLPKGKEADLDAKDLENIELNKVKSYLVKIFFYIYKSKYALMKNKTMQ